MVGSEKTDKKLFSPFRLGAFEEYIVCDDKPDFPMSQIMLWYFRGSVDRNSLEQALKALFDFTPFLTAHIERRYGKRFWIPSSPDQFPKISWFESNRDILSETTGVTSLDVYDLKREPGVRIQIECGKDAFLIRTSIHHALSDGLGIVQFMGDWFALYEQIKAGRDLHELELPDPKQFNHREDLKFVPPEKVPFSRKFRTILYEVFQWFRRRPIPLNPLRSRWQPVPRDSWQPETADFLSALEQRKSRSADLQEGQPRLYWRSFPLSFMDACHRIAKRQGVSINTLLLRDFYLTLRRWASLTEKEEKKNGLYFRVLIPTSLRNEYHRSLSMTNLLGYNFIDRLPRKCNRDPEFLQTLQTTIDLSRKWGSGAIFLNGVRFFRRIPFALSILTARLFCHSTAVFSNTGFLCKNIRQERFRTEQTIRIENELELVRIIGGPPVRVNTPISLGIVSHHDEMVLGFCVDDTVFDREKFLDFFDLFKKELDQTLEEAGEHT